MTSFFSLELTLLSERWILFPEISRILQTIFLFGTTYCRMNLILPGAISEETIVPCFPLGSSTDVIVLLTSFTLHSIRSPSSMKLNIIWVFKGWLVVGFIPYILGYKFLSTSFIRKGYGCYKNF